MKHKIFFAFRAILFLIGFLFVAYGMIYFGEYLGDFRDYYFKTGDYGKVLALVAITLGIGYVLRKLLIWEYRKETGITRRRRK